MVVLQLYRGGMYLDENLLWRRRGGGRALRVWRLGWMGWGGGGGVWFEGGTEGGWRGDGGGFLRSWGADIEVL